MRDFIEAGKITALFLGGTLGFFALIAVVVGIAALVAIKPLVGIPAALLALYLSIVLIIKADRRL